jgi:TPR repeat protein
MTSAQLDKLLAKAAKGDSKAMLDLAIALGEDEGQEGEEWDKKKARDYFKWMKKAAEAGEPEAAHELARAYKEGIGTKKSLDDYIEWLERARELNFTMATVDLAHAYGEGEGVQPDESRFFELIKEAAEGGDRDAMLDLAFAFRDGTGHDANPDSYFSWLLKSAESGNKDAMLHLAFEYKNRTGDPKKNSKSFFKWLKKAAEDTKDEEGHQDALFHLAIAYLNGEGTKLNIESYFEWLKKAAERNTRAGLYHLAMSYLKGIGTEQDMEQFSHWIERAMKAGHPRAFIASGIDDLRKELLGEQLPVMPQQLVELHEDLNRLFDIVMGIKQEHIIKDEEAGKCVYHFTRFEALESMLPAEPLAGKPTNLLRLYNFAYMNDPQEGKRLLDKKLEETELLREFFNEENVADNPLSWDEHESSVYIGSFTFRGDEFEMWRTTYGNNGQGYCIVTPLTAFKQGSQRADIIHGGEVVNVTEREFGAAGFVQPTLYDIRYKESAVLDTLRKLNGGLQIIKEKKQGMADGLQAIDRTVRLIVSHILYLYKNEIYGTEKEARMLGEFDIKFDGLKLDSSRRPSRIYVTTLESLLQEGSHIIIGPTVPEQNFAELDLKYRLARNGLDKVKISRSKHTGMYR